MTDSDVLVAEWFETSVAAARTLEAPPFSPILSGSCTSVVGVRCEADINGFCSVFEQFLETRDDLEFFAGALGQLGEDDLAQTYTDIGRLLASAGYYDDPTRELHALPATAQEQLERLQTRAAAGERLWKLDDKLAQLRKP